MKRLLDLVVVLLCCLVTASAQETNYSESSDVHAYVYYSGDEDYDENYDLENADDIDEFLKSLEGVETGDSSFFGDIEKDGVIMQPIDTAVIVMYSIITIVGLLANGIVFFVIFAGNEIGKTVTAIYVLQLTVADTVFLFTLPVFSMQKVQHTWAFGAGLCTICQTIKFMNYYAGIFFLMAMSVDRYIAVAYSTRLTQIRTKRRTYIVCLCMWSAALLMSLPLMLYARTETAEGLDVSYCRVMFPGYRPFDVNDTIVPIDDRDYFSSDQDDENGTMTDLLSDMTYSYQDDVNPPNWTLNQDPEHNVCGHTIHSQQYKSWLIVDFVIGFVIPFSVIAISYFKILTHLKGSERKIGHTSSNRAAKMRKRVTRMVAALVICFTVCWLPHHLFVLLKIRGFYSSVSVCDGIEQFFVALAFSNSAINPILYTFMGHNFRERLRKSINNTQSRIRKNSKQSIHHAPTGSNTHSDPANAAKRLSAAVVSYHRGSKLSTSKDANSGSQRSSSKRGHQISLLGFRRKNGSDEGSQNQQNCVGQNPSSFYPSTTLGEQTVETKI